MRKNFIAGFISLFIVLAFVSCDLFSSGGEEQSESETFTLTVKNLSRYTMTVAVGSAKKSCGSGGGEIKFSKDDGLSEGLIYVYLSYVRSAVEPEIVCRISNPVSIVKNEETRVEITDYTAVEDSLDSKNRGTVASLKTATTLTVKNSSSFDLADVTWRGTVFSSNPMESVLEKGSEEKASVDVGYGYLFFTRKSDNAVLRSKDIINIKNRGSDEVYEILDSTLSLEVNYETNTGTLSSIEKKVVFFDGAEGNIFAYSARSNVTYAKVSGSGKFEPNSPYSGDYCFRMNNGSYSSGCSYLEFIVDMEHSGTLSFWYYDRSNYADLTLCVNNESKKSFGTVDYQWSCCKQPLEEGRNVIKLSSINVSTSDFTQYRYLDDILIVYDE